MPKYAFNPGDEVRIRASTKYNNCWEGYSGVVTEAPYTPLSGEVVYPVRFNTVTGVTGRFWYREADLEPKEMMTFTPDCITNVIFNAPATIVFWKDGTKTVVKCGPKDIYDEEVGLTMAILKKMFGNDNTFHKVFKKWLPEPEATDVEMLMSFKWLLSKLPDPKETAHTDGQKFYSMSDILREGMMSLYFKEHGEELRLDDKEKE